jgi:glycosyltransferase involved in cell wall biosynthesis
MSTAAGSDHGARTVCILLPTYNDAAYLKDTIQSILSQSFTDFELIILDNASDDATPEVVKAINDARVTYHRHPENLGFLGNLNAGFKLARGRYLVVQNSDDQWEPAFLQCCVERLEYDHRLVAVHSGARWIDAEDAAFGTSSRGWPEYADTPEAFLRLLDTGFTFAATVFRMDVIENVTPLNDPSFQRIADTELLLRTCLLGPIGYVDKPLCLYRVHDNSMSLKMYGSGEFFRIHLEAIEKVFQWPETQAAGLLGLRSKAMAAVAMESLRMIHLGRENTNITGHLRLYAEIVSSAPQVMWKPQAWLRLLLGLLPRGMIRGLRTLRRSVAMRS